MLHELLHILQAPAQTLLLQSLPSESSWIALPSPTRTRDPWLVMIWGCHSAPADRGAGEKDRMSYPVLCVWPSPRAAQGVM